MSTTSVHPQTQVTWAMSGLLVAVAAFTFFGAISLMVNTWMSRTTYSHGFLVPLISLYLTWMNKERLKEIPIRPNIIGGLSVVLSSCVLLVAGTVSGVSIAQQISLLILIPGLVLALLGTRYLRALALPIAYLLLMVPVLDVIINRVQWPFQLLTATMAVRILSVLNIPVYLNNQLIELPNVTLEVAKACSGVQYLVTIAAVAIPLAYFLLSGVFRRGIFLLTAVVVGIMTNWLRVVLIALLSYAGAEVLHGPMHIFQGLFVSVFGFIVIFLIALLMRRVSSNPPDDPENRPGNAKANMPASASGNTGFTKAWSIVLVVLLGAGGFIYLHKAEPVALKAPLTQLSPNAKGWVAEMKLDPLDVPFTAVGADEELHRIYVGPSGRKLHLYVGYFESQQQGKELIHYTLDPLYKNTREINVEIAEDRTVTINTAVAQSGRNKYLALYWHELNGRTVANRYRAKMITARDGIMRGVTNGALVVIYSEIGPGQDQKSLLAAEIEFAKAALGSIKEHLPTT